jgi:hypothetical protein
MLRTVGAQSLPLRQISRILNHPAPRAGDPIKLLTGSSGSARVEINADMPGSVDLRTGLVHVNYRLWPLWQMLGIDNILTCLEVSGQTRLKVASIHNAHLHLQVALSNSGRIVFVSKYAEALGLAVKDLKYIVELRGWRGLALPLLHAVGPPLKTMPGRSLNVNLLSVSGISLFWWKTRVHISWSVHRVEASAREN